MNGITRGALRAATALGLSALGFFIIKSLEKKYNFFSSTRRKSAGAGRICGPDLDFIVSAGAFHAPAGISPLKNRLRFFNCADYIGKRTARPPAGPPPRFRRVERLEDGQDGPAAQQRAFEQLMRYDSDTAYGLKGAGER